MRKIRVVQIGTAHDHAADHVDTVHALGDQYELVGVCEPDEALRAAAMQRRSYDGLRMSYEGVRWLTMDEIDAMTDLDAAIIETDELSLVPTAQKMADKGLAIHMDKPCGVDYPAFERLVRTMERRHLPLHIGYMYRYNAAVRACKEWADSGALGDIFAVEAQMSVFHTAEKRAWLKKFKGGMMFFLGCHMVDLVCMFCGEPTEVVPFNTSTRTDGVDSEDMGFAVLRYPNGVSFVKTCGAEVDGFNRRQVVITGTGGTVRIEPIEARTGGPNVEEFAPVHVCFRADGEKTPFGASGKEQSFGPFGRYIDMMADFAAIVRGEHENPFPYEYELTVQRTLLKACGNWNE